MSRIKLTFADVVKGRKKWKEALQKLAARGANEAEIAAYLGISKAMFQRIRKEEEEVQDMWDYLQTISEAYYDKKSRINLENRDFSYQGFGMIMKQKFDWDKKQEIDITSGGEKIDIPPIAWVGGSSNSDD